MSRPGWWRRPTWPRVRVRRPEDSARLGLALAGLVALLALALLAPGVLRAGADLVPTALRGLPRTLLSIANVAASLAVLCTILLVLADGLRLRRFALVPAAAACALGLLVAWGVQQADAVLPRADGGPLLGPVAGSALVAITAAVALLVGADLRRRRPWLGAARGSLTAALVCALALGSLTVPGAAAALLLGGAAGLGARVALGVVPARPAEDVVRAELARAGLPVSGLRALEAVAGRARYAAADDDGELLVTVVDPDRRGVPLLRRGWRVLRLRSAAVGRPALSLRGQLEQQALVTSLAGAAGVATPATLALLPAGPALVLVERPLRGTPWSATAPDGGPQAAAALDAAFATLRRLHGAALAHGRLSGDAVVLLPDGRAGLTGLSAAQPAATELQRQLDVAALLVTGAVRLGAGRAVAALRSGYGTDPGSERTAAALLQPLALPRPVRAAVRGTSVLADLRTTLAGGAAAVAAGVPRGRGGARAASGRSGQPPRLERFRLLTVLGVAGATVAVHLLATQLSQIGLAATLRQADPGWLAVALAGSALTYPGSALVLQAFVPERLRLGRTTLVQLASSFLTLVTPPTVGHVGLNVRYLYRARVPTATATAAVAVSQVVTVVVSVAVLLVCGWLSGVSASRPALLPRGNVLAVLLVAAGALALLAALPAGRRLVRARVEPLLRRTLPQLLAAAADPRRLAAAVLGIAVLIGGNVLALDASLRAFGADLGVPALVVVYLAGSTLGSAAPTPGGLGAVEAALVAGLTATGVPVAAALPSVLAFRTATFWLPAPVGWVAFVALQRRDRI